MRRTLRIAAVALAATATLVSLALWAAYHATRQVRPFYREALALDVATLERGKQELESRATALYTDARQTGAWRALFTGEQINGWLAGELADRSAELGIDVDRDVREPRVSISPDVLTVGFRTSQGGVDTVISVDASVFLVDDSEVGVRVLSVHAGTLPLPVALVADKLAAACRKLRLPVLWTQQDDQPVAMIKIASAESPSRRLSLDSIELNKSVLYVAGHTEFAETTAGKVDLDDIEVRMSPTDDQSLLEIARKGGPAK